MQRTKSTLRSIAGHLCGILRRMTTTKEHAKSVTRRTTCIRDGNANASGSSGTFLPRLTQTLLPLARPLSSDQVVRPGSLWSTSVCNTVEEDKHCLLGTPPQLFRHIVSLPVCLPLQSNGTPPGLQGQLNLAVKVEFCFLYF